MILSIFTLSIAYAALSVSLKIQGNAEVVASSWNIHFDNIIFSGDDNPPKITSATSVVFNPTFNMPGDKYTFTVDIVNDGTIDAIIENIEVDSNLTDEQSKYLKTNFTYANGDDIRFNQMVEAGKFVRLKVYIEYNSDLDVSDLPTSQNIINFSVTFTYSQRNEEAIKVENNGVDGLEAILAGGNALGEEVCLKDECFYILFGEPAADGSYADVALLSKYNLYVGNEVTFYDNNFNVSNNTSVFSPLQNPVARQDSRAIGFNAIELEDGNYEYLTPFYGTIGFAKSSYWTADSTWDELLYNRENLLLPYLNEYKDYLISLGFDIEEVIIPPMELFNSAVAEEETVDVSFLSSTSYWLLGAFSNMFLPCVQKNGSFFINSYLDSYTCGIRPLILYRYYK